MSESRRVSRVDRALYWTGWFLFKVLLVVFYRARAVGGENVPRSGGCLIVANHQSHLDPPIVGTSIRYREVNFIARTGLYKAPVLGFLISRVMTIPIREETGDMAAIKAAIERINAGRCVCIFAEGTRSPDGTLQPFKRGVALLLKRAKCPVIPVAVEGAYDAMPKGRTFPKLSGRIECRIGEAIGHEELLEGGSDAALVRISEAVESLRLEARESLRALTKGRIPAPGPGDERAGWLQ